MPAPHLKCEHAQAKIHRPVPNTLLQTYSRTELCRGWKSFFGAKDFKMFSNMTLFQIRGEGEENIDILHVGNVIFKVSF